MEQLLSRAQNAEEFEPPQLRQLRERRRKANTGLARITKFVFPRTPKLSHLANSNANPSTTDKTFQRTHSSERVRKFEGEFARVLSGRVPALALVKKVPGLPLDLSRWHLDLVVNKLQGRHYIQQRLVITPEVIVMGCMGTSQGNDCQHLKLSMKVCVCVCVCVCLWAQTFDQGMCVCAMRFVGRVCVWAWLERTMTRIDVRL